MEQHANAWESTPHEQEHHWRGDWRPTGKTEVILRQPLQLWRNIT